MSEISEENKAIYLKQYIDETKALYHIIDKWELQEKFFQACKNGMLELVQYIFTCPALATHINIHAQDDAALNLACQHGHLAVVKYLLTSPDLIEHANLFSFSQLGFKSACERGHLEIVQYLSSSPELKEHVDIHQNNEAGCLSACNYGHFNIVQFFLCSPLLKEHTNIHIDHDSLIRTSCYLSHFEMIYFLLCSPLLKEHANVHALENEAFIYANTNKDIAVMEFLVFDCHIDYTKELMTYCENQPQAKKLFEIRALNDKLDKQLDEKNNHSSIKKVKI